MSRVFPCNDVTGKLNLNPLTCNPVRALFPLTRVHSQFTALSEPLLNQWGTTSCQLLQAVPADVGTAKEQWHEEKLSNLKLSVFGQTLSIAWPPLSRERVNRLNVVTE